METKKRVICITDLTDGLTKDKVYEVNYIHYGQTVYYDVTDDNGNGCIHRTDDFIDTKQVVVNSDGARTTSIPALTPYWIVELFKRKGNILYAYEWNYDENGDCYYELINIDNYKDFKTMYNIMYSYKKIEGRIYESNNSIVFEESIYEYSLFNKISREDKDLIDIVKEINNESVIKIVDIPIDVKYYIQSEECGFAEIIVEKHREWK